VVSQNVSDLILLHFLNKKSPELIRGFFYQKSDCKELIIH